MKAMKRLCVILVLALVGCGPVMPPSPLSSGVYAGKIYDYTSLNGYSVSQSSSIRNAVINDYGLPCDWVTGEEYAVGRSYVYSGNNVETVLKVSSIAVNESNVVVNFQAIYYFSNKTLTGARSTTYQVASDNRIEFFEQTLTESTDGLVQTDSHGFMDKYK